RGRGAGESASLMRPSILVPLLALALLPGCGRGGANADRGPKPVKARVKVLPVELELGAEQQRASYEQTRARLGLPEGGDDLSDPKDAAEVKRAQAALEDAQQKFQRTK